MIDFIVQVCGLTIMICIALGFIGAVGAGLCLCYAMGKDLLR